MKQVLKGRFVLAAAALAGSAGLAQADTTSELQDLRARIEALEAENQQAASIPGDFRLGNTAVDIYGYAKADFYYDFDFIQGDTAFVNNIGEPVNATDGDFGATVRQSRLGIRTTTESDIGTLQGQLEFDLFASGGRSELRLRHANIQVGDHWTFGQTWTNFMPLGQYPTSVEFNGPVGIAFARVPQIRYSNSFGEGFDYSLSLEENSSASSDPVFTAAAQYSNDRFTARIAGLTGTIESGGVEVDQTGVTLSGSITPWDGGLFQATYVNGEALGPLLIGVGDAIVGGQANDVEGYTLEFRQDIGNKWNVGIGYGREDYDLATSTGSLSFTELETIHVNAFYSPTDNLTLSAEYIFGERNDAASGNTFDGDRVQLAVQLNF
ncbi:DcaP family trimeric outer membrane transporter [Leisingera sp. SS27]|uniref:DcaP family trimeric outer membrane transporter n=1 Tax=Leisingera sp. SS27 TaxID=2979462 RepID=UPI00232CA9B3|nr:DcaP family trimeric outer membrane transporter [Leisingera sp. SS27]MDC0659833.1 DcaP family trimeric outer membrane transporter [Leisingera sp. SS27]